MSECDNADTSKCDSPTTTSLAISTEGKWVGISISLWLLVLLLAWVFRTCTKTQRRQRVLRKVLCWYDQDQDQRSAGATGHSDAGSRGQDGSALHNGKSPPFPPQSTSTLSHTPPPCYHQAVRSSYSLNDVIDEGADMCEDDDDDDDSLSEICDCFDVDGSIRSSSPKNGGDVNGNGPKHGGKFLRRHSKCSFSSLSITLETIQEDINEAKHSTSEPEIRTNVFTLTSSRSQSLPSCVEWEATFHRPLVLDIPEESIHL